MFSFIKALYWHILLVLCMFFLGLAAYCIIIIIPFNKQKRTRIVLRGTKLISKILMSSSGSSVRVSGLENYDTKTSYIIVSNHQSGFDIYALAGYLCKDYSFLSKTSYKNIPMLGIAMVESGFLFIDRTNVRKALSTLKVAAAKMKNGTSIIIFPEGTRSIDGKIAPFKLGAFTLAAMCEEIRFLPVTLIGTLAIHQKGAFLVNAAKVHIVVDKPITCTRAELRNSQKKQAIVTQIEKKIKANYQKWLPKN